MNILVIEDNLGDVSLLREAIEEAHKEVTLTHASRLDEALAEPDWAEKYDLVLLDLNLPDAQWHETLYRLDTDIEHIPVVVMTSMYDEDVALQAIRAGAQDYLIKGHYDSALLKRTMRYAIERFRLINELKSAREREWRLANLDPLTELPNRRLFEERLNQGIHEAKRNGEHLAVLFVDLDRFKWVNDSLGHEIGDQMLRSVADQLRHCVRGEDSVARLGGDEFIVLLRSLQQPQDAGVVAKKIIAQLSQPMSLNGHAVAIGASVGIALYPADSTSKSQLIRFADLAMYRAKSTGKGNLCFYSADLERLALDRLKLESALRAAIIQGELALYYQPIVDLSNGRVKGQEALIRWQSPQQGLLPPAQFIPFSEQSDLIFSLDNWVLQQACLMAQNWQALVTGPQRIAVNVNLSARHFRHPQRIVERVRDSLEKAKLPASLLEIEVTETAFMQASQETIETLEALRDLGVKIAIDDFGVGYSSLNYLKTLPLDVLKVDRSFLIDVPANPRNTALAAAIIQLGMTLGLEVVAEGVENRQQLDWLQRLGCGYAQGYLFARPAPEPQFYLDNSR